MKVKFSLLTEQAGTVDLLAELDPTTSIGDLAAQMWASGPSGEAPVDASATLAVFEGGVGGRWREVEPSSLLVESGIRSGSTVRLARADSRFSEQGAGQPVAVLKVIAGPDEGKEYPLAAGSSEIGRDLSCEVTLNDPLVSRRHARVQVGASIEMVDLGSVNGILVGDEAADRVVISGSDRVRLGDSVIAVTQLATVPGFAEPHVIAFNRSPRVEPLVPVREFAAPQPPEQPRGQRFPILPLFLPLMMGAVLYVTTRSLTSIVFMALSPLMMMGNVVEGRIAGSRNYEKAVAQFRQDVQDLADDLRRAQADEIRGRLGEHPGTAECVEAALHRQPLLWSRRPDLPRMLELRLGLGRQASRNTIDFRSGNAGNRALRREMEEELRTLADVEGVPVTASLTETALGVAGPRPQAIGVAHALALQAVCLHSPAELSVAGLTSARSAVSWEWLKWLPHCLAAQSPLSSFPLASSKEGCAALLADLDRLVAERLSDGDAARRLPSVLVVIEDDAPVERSRAVSIAERGPSVGVHVLWVSSAVEELPAACRIFVEMRIGSLDPVAGFVHQGSTVEPLVVESAVDGVTMAVGRVLAAVTDASAVDDAQGDLPRSISLLTLAGNELASIPEAVIEKWTESHSILTGPFAGESRSRRAGTLRALVGASVGGPYVLDLRANGPHALVGGTTGSGKSELLQSWILAMAAANSPQRVTFLLVDYKGGSAFSECVRLPHTVGLVTDLSPHLVRRALTSLKAELRYREQTLHRKRAKDLLELERTGDPDAPPSLIIVVDEFAALVNEVPEFVDGVVDVAQRGRSLGLHLILATQRPAGVIKDNLRANTNLRLALRMADEADSTDVLGSDEAAGFDPGLPGRAISRTGPSKLTPFQSAYVGGWTSDREPPPRIVINTFGFSPTQVIEPPPDLGLPSTDDLGPTDIQRIVANIRQANHKAKLPEPRRPWLSELAAVYDLAKLPSRRRDDELVFGVLDDPQNQTQPTVAFHPDRDGNLAVFGTGGSGKSTLLRTLAIAAGITVRGGPTQVYGIDFGARGLQMLEELPHVGSVISGSDIERITRLFDRLMTTIDERATRYSKSNAGTITDYRRVSGMTDEPRILLLVDGIGAMRTAFEATEHNRLFEQFLRIAADGRPVGVHVVVAGDRLGSMPTSLASQVQCRVVLRLADSGDYSLMGLAGDVLDSKSPPGRGLLSDAELQVAVLGGHADVLEQARALAGFAAAMRNAGAAEAPPIERLTDQIALADLPAAVRGRPVIGVSGVTLGPATFEPTGVFLICGPPASGRSTALVCLAESLRRSKKDYRLFYFGSARSPVGSWYGWEKVALDDDQAATLATEVAALIDEEDQAGRPTAVFIESLPGFISGTADFPLQELVRKLVASGHLAVGEGETGALGASYPLVVAFKNGRAGIVLQPEQFDGNLLHSQFPRLRKSDFPPGRGLLVPRGGQPYPVQLGLPGG